MVPGRSEDPNLSKQVLREELKARLQDLQADIRSVSTRLNSLIESASLPEELLEYIFLYCVGSCINSEPLLEPRRPHRRVVQLLSILHVCQRWREVALGCSRLWSEIIVPCHPDFLAASLCRSGNLDLDITVMPTANVDTVAAMLALFPRASSFVLFTDGDTLEDAHYSVTGPLLAPRFRMLGMHITTPALSPDISAAYIALLLEPTVTHFECSDPSGFPTSLLYPHQFPSITRLNVTLCRFTRRDQINALSLLRCFPRLKHLDISCTKPDSLESLLPVEMEDVQLPELHTLVMAQHALSCAALLRKLIFPSTTMFGTVDVRYPSRLYRSILTTAAARLASNRAGTALRRLTVSIISVPQDLPLVRIRGWHDVGLGNEDIQPHLDWHLPFTGCDILSDVRKELQLEDAQHLTLDTTGFANWSFLASEGFADFPAVHTLQLRGPSRSSFGRLIASEDNVDAVLPRLDRIVLDRVCVADCPSTEGEPGCMHVHDLIQALQLRHDQGRPVMRVEVKGCLESISESSESWERISGLVQEIIVS